MAASPDSIPIRTSSGACEPGSDGEPGSHRAQRIVLVHGRQAEDCHHRVADELLRPAAERKQLLRRRAEELTQDLAGSLRVEAAPEAG
jgi:hypothetical protein